MTNSTSARKEARPVAGLTSVPSPTYEWVSPPLKIPSPAIFLPKCTDHFAALLVCMTACVYAVREMTHAHVAVRRQLCVGFFLHHSVGSAGLQT